jgi:hypothetical protein
MMMLISFAFETKRQDYLHISRNPANKTRTTFLESLVFCKSFLWGQLKGVTPEETAKQAQGSSRSYGKI